MRKKFIIFLSFLCGFSVNCDAIETKAKSVFVIDYDSGAVLVSKNPDILMPPSSMLKLMTLNVLFDAIKSGELKMTDKLSVSENADYKNPLWYPASKMCLVKGQEITVKDAISAIIVLSAGDASVVVAEKIAGSETEFTHLMQKNANKIGLKQSSFGNASGLPNPNNLMTSRDLSILAKHIISEHSDLYPMFATKRFEFEDTKTDWCADWVRAHTLNYNKLLFIMPGADGMKTGHTDDGGYGMVASSIVGGRRLIGVINGFYGNGHEALANEMKRILTHGYKNTKNKIFYKSGEDVLEIPVWYGRYPKVTATVNETVAITQERQENIKDIRVLARYKTPVAAPITQGQILGEIVVEKNGDVIKRIPLIAKDKVRKIQFVGRIIKNISIILWKK